MRIRSLSANVTKVAFKMVVTVFANIGHIFVFNQFTIIQSMDGGRLYIPLKSEFDVQSQLSVTALKAFRRF